MQLLEFLEVEKLPLNAAVKKLELRRLAECIENYRELKEEFSSTRWARFFDEDANPINRQEHPG